MTIHTLKCWPAFYDSVASGAKNFELRLDDRGYQPGDTLLLCRTFEDNPELIEFDQYNEDGTIPKTAHPKHMLSRKVTYCLHGPNFGLMAGYVIMSLEDEK